MTSSDDTVTTEDTEQRDPIERIVVMGTGFIGLPLALMLAQSEKRVIGVDIDENLVDAINDTSLNLDEQELQRLLEDNKTEEYLTAQTEPTSADAFVISVPTPIKSPQKSPDLSHLKGAINAIIPYLEEGDLINVESTIPPLTCDEVISPRLREAGFKPGEDVLLAHSPERILPGNVFEEIKHNDRVIGGIDDKSKRRAAELYEPFLEGNLYHTDLVSAELCKLMENTFRDINVAIANEFALIGDELDINIQDVIKLANHHPRVDILDPGIGVGGHCLPVDPWFLNEADPEHTNLITTARRINDMMPGVANEKIRHAVSTYDNPQILVLGLAYKPNTYDTRNSPARDIIGRLERDGYDVDAYDRNADDASYDLLSTLLDRHDPDVVVQLVPHDETVDQIDALRSDLQSQGITIIQFANQHTFAPRIDE